MGIALLKKMNNFLPDPVKAAAAPLIRSRLVKNVIFIEQYRELDDAALLNESELEDLQLKKLKSVLIHAYEHTVYYRNLFNQTNFDPYRFESFEELSSIPLLTKELIESNFEDIQADDVLDSYVGETGGSTGKPLRVLLERASIYKEKAFIYHFWAKYGYDYKKSRVATFRGVDFNGKITKINPLYSEIILNPFILAEKNVDIYVSKINRFGAEFVHGYPSAISNFCRLLNKNNIKLKKPVKAVFLISESCSADQKRIIENTFSCPAVAFYGHTERAVFAEQCGTDLLYKFNSLYGYTEFVEREEGNIVCTGFLNTKFPLIRYALDDQAIETGNHIYQIEGHHTGAYLYGSGGEQITQTAINFHDDTFLQVEGYQFYQDKKGYAECRVISNTALPDSDLEKIRHKLEEKTGSGLVWNVTQVQKLELTGRGKLKMIIQKLDICGGGVKEANSCSCHLLKLHNRRFFVAPIIEEVAA